MKKLIALLIALGMCAAAFAGCAPETNGGDQGGDVSGETPGGEETPHEHAYVYTDEGEQGHKKACSGCDETFGVEPHVYDGETDLECNVCGHARDWLAALSEETRENLSSDGYVDGKIIDFSVYEGTAAYRQVSTAEELVQAIKDAQYHYKNVWNDEVNSYTQEPADGYTEDNFKGTVKVIEITDDINLGYYQLSSEAKKDASIVSDFCRTSQNSIKTFTMSEMFEENGMSQISLSNISDLLIYSKDGAKLTHGGFKLTSCDNVVFRNLEFDELWQWEDSSSATTGAVGDYDAFGWAYFKISFCGYVWIDHCTFGKSYDGQIDYANVNYTANSGVAFRAPYGADGNNGLHISWCNFNAGSDDEDGYLYKMMKAIEDDYQAGGQNYLYYNALRKGGASFEDILYGLAVPQKKGFLCGDNNTYPEPDYLYNLGLNVSFANCTFLNLEDRLPKVRGGNAYMYNCVVDSSLYHEYHTVLKALDASSIVKAVNSSWKCALTSQGIVCGNGGSVMAQNCIFRGIVDLVKHNDKKNEGEYVYGGYQLINCSYQLGKDDEVYVGSTTDAGNKFPTDSTGNLKPEYFEWHTYKNEAPFTVNAYGLDVLESVLANVNFGSGAGAKLEGVLLKSAY